MPQHLHRFTYGQDKSTTWMPHQGLLQRRCRGARILGGSEPRAAREYPLACQIRNDVRAESRLTVCGPVCPPEDKIPWALFDPKW
jgi:hypothetical protein